MDDPRFWALREALASYASDPDDPPVRDDDVIQAAVSVIVRGRDSLDLLLIKRAEHERDPWSGHMALPGGRRDPVDDDLVRTAVRETLEETGLDLDDHGHRLGRLEQVVPVSRRLPSLSIRPYVFGVGAGARARVASREVDAVHWVPLHLLTAPDVRSEVEIELGRETRTFPCFRVGGEVVWGLTYRILTDFLEAYPAATLRAL